MVQLPVFPVGQFLVADFTRIMFLTCMASSDDALHESPIGVSFPRPAHAAFGASKQLGYPDEKYKLVANWDVGAS